MLRTFRKIGATPPPLLLLGAILVAVVATSAHSVRADVMTPSHAATFTAVCNGFKYDTCETNATCPNPVHCWSPQDGGYQKQLLGVAYCTGVGGVPHPGCNGLNTVLNCSELP